MQLSGAVRVEAAMRCDGYRSRLDRQRRAIGRTRDAEDERRQREDVVVVTIGGLGAGAGEQSEEREEGGEDTHRDASIHSTI
jgi:hypothetical protein